MSDIYEESFKVMLRELGYDLKSSHFKDSPKRMAKEMKKWCKKKNISLDSLEGTEDPFCSPLFPYPEQTSFDLGPHARLGDAAPIYPGGVSRSIFNSSIISIKDIAFTSRCAHHGLPFFGTVSLAYVPKDKIVGLSKFTRLVEYYATQYTVQEFLGEMILESMVGVARGVKLSAKHGCICARGVKDNTQYTITYTTYFDSPEMEVKYTSLIKEAIL
jgi:GTP cyclohydrolase I